jgi:hypothetical protein
MVKSRSVRDGRINNIYRGTIGDGRAPHNNSRERDEFQTDETEDETVITVETPPAVMLPAWVNFLQQRLYVLHVDYKQIGAGRIVVVSTPPRATESVARLVISTVEIADYYVKTLFSKHGPSGAAPRSSQQCVVVG